MTKNVVAQSTPSIVVSIKPIHSIVTKIMDGVTKPELLLDSNSSAHTFHLKPSQIKMISNADLVIVISENFELGLRKALKNINEDSHLKISELDQLIIHNSRGEAIYNKNEDSSKFDFHLWLDVNNMQLIATYISNIISELDPKNEHIYSENLKELNLELDELKEQIKQQLAPVSSTPFAIYSDTLQYFEKNLELKRPVIITPFHGAGLSIKRTIDAKRKIKDLNISCLIYDTEVKAKQLRVLSEGLNLKSFKIDILGNEFTPGLDQYFNLMKKISSQLSLCLK